MRSASERPDCGRAATWSSTMTAIGWRWARSASAAGIQAPLRGAATGVGAGVGLGDGGGLGLAVGFDLGGIVGSPGTAGEVVVGWAQARASESRTRTARRWAAEGRGKASTAGGGGPARPSARDAAGARTPRAPRPPAPPGPTPGSPEKDPPPAPTRPPAPAPTRWPPPRPKPP